MDKTLSDPDAIEAYLDCCIDDLAASAAGGACDIRSIPIDMLRKDRPLNRLIVMGTPRTAVDDKWYSRFLPSIIEHIDESGTRRVMTLPARAVEE
jgi:hypothetical protein